MGCTGTSVNSRTIGTSSTTSSDDVWMSRRQHQNGELSRLGQRILQEIQHGMSQVFLIHGDSDSEADTKESFDGSDHDTEASDEHDSSNEGESIADEGDNDDDGDDDDDDSNEVEGEGDDDNSSSDSQISTDDEDDDDSVWNGIRRLSWTSELGDTFDDKKAEFVEGGMSASDAHQAAYRCVLPNLR